MVKAESKGMPGMQNVERNTSRGARQRGGGGGARCMRHRAGGFTVIELLVVVTIIALLLGILIPALNQGRLATQIGVTTQFMRKMSMALAAYYNDLNTYPPSDYQATGHTGNSDAMYEWSGGAIVVQALMGHLPEGTSPIPPNTDGDGKEGLGFRVGGRVWGPYMDTTREQDLIPRWDKDGDTTNNREFWGTKAPPERPGAYVFADYWTSPICYYRARPHASDLWAAGGRFNPNDNTQLFQGQTGEPGEEVPTNMDPQIDGDDERADAAALRSARFILFSRGPDKQTGTSDTEEDDIIVTGP
jgi:prepilin-type N-terminal cleavage/methylation domain-containing protein